MAKLPALAQLIFMALKTAAFLVFCWAAYKIRLHAIEEYGRVIHEFDPWFNFRATEVRSKSDRFYHRAVTADSALEKTPDLKTLSSTWRNTDGQSFSIGLIIAVGIPWVALSEQQSIPECRSHPYASGKPSIGSDIQ